MALHALILVSLPWLAPARNRDQPAATDRPARIVLARTMASKVSYFPAPVAHHLEQQTPVVATLPSVDAVGAASALPESSTPSVAIVSSALPRGLPQVGGRGEVPGGSDFATIMAEEAARRASEASAGPVTELSLFGAAPASGRSFVFLIDRSKSMGRQGTGALAAAERELLRSLAGLDPRHRFQVIAYHHQCVFLLESRMLPATPENMAALEGYLSGLAAFGATNHEQAIISAISLRPDVVFLLTDGGEPALSAGARQRIRRIAQRGTSIHCIQFGLQPTPPARNFLERVAAENRGSYHYVDMSGQRP